jgi:hypothetical protein
MRAGVGQPLTVRVTQEKIREWPLAGRQGTFVDNAGDYADSLFTIFLLAAGIGVSTIFGTSNRGLVP